MRVLHVVTITALASGLLAAAEKYTGPRPPKADVPYLMHADNLVETEQGTAANEQRKDSTYAVIDGAASTAKTPLAEPVFLIRADKVQVDKLEAYRLDVKNGKREVLIGHKKPKNVARPIHLEITRLDEKLYRVEVDEPLENGEYSLTPAGSDAVFSFAIY
jgi:hypothetical protein